MRTTIKLDEDIAAAIEQMRRDEGIGPSQALNRLARAGLSAPRDLPQFRQTTFEGRLLIDVSDIGEALEIAEGPEHR